MDPLNSLQTSNTYSARSEKECDKTAKKADEIRECAFYINYIMKTKGVTREVAEAQDDFFS